MYICNCCFLTWIQISQEASKVVWYSHLLKNFLQFVIICTVKGFNIVSEAEEDAFLEFFYFFCDPEDVGNLIAGSSAFSNSSLNIWKFLVHVLLKPGMENFEHCFTSMWDECSCVVVRTFFGIAFLWDWNENWLWPLLSFPVLLMYWVQGRGEKERFIHPNAESLEWLSPHMVIQGPGLLPHGGPIARFLGVLCVWLTGGRGEQEKRHSPPLKTQTRSDTAPLFTSHGWELIIRPVPDAEEAEICSP